MQQTAQQQLPIFVINLPEGKKRRAFISKQMQQHNLNYEFFKASRGDELSQEFLAKFKIQQGAKLCGRELARPELGCIFSHYLLLKKIAAEEIPAALILEDDAVMTQESTYLVNNFQNIRGDWDLLNIGYRCANSLGKPLIGKNIYPLSHWYCKKITRPELRASNIHIGPLIASIWGTFAYFVTNQGAKHLVQVIEQQPIVPYDNFLYRYRKHLRYYATTPNLVNHVVRPIDNEVSIIEQHIMYERAVKQLSYVSTIQKPQRIGILAKTKSWGYKTLGAEEHPLYWLYKIAKYLSPAILLPVQIFGYLKQSKLKTKQVFSRPIMRQD